MAATDPYSGDATRRFDPALHWREDLKNYSPAASMFSRKSGESGLVGNVDNARAAAALRFFLGYANVSTGPTFTLQRTPPAYHPEFPGLVCTGASADNFKPYPQSRSGVTGLTAKVAPVTLPTGSPTPYGTSVQNRTAYYKSKITARFSPVAYPMLGDSEVVGTDYLGNPQRQEWRRWCWIDQEPRVEMLSLSGFQMVYTEGAGLLPANTVSSPAGKQYPAEVGQVLMKSDLRVTWEEVPESWVMAVGTVFPFNILKGLGCVNAYNWSNYFAGTLLLNGVKFTRHPWSLAAGTEDRFLYTIEFLMSFFDPPKGFTGNPAVSLTLVGANGEPTDPRGHVCFPWRGIVSAGDMNAGKWFCATYDGSTGGKRLYDSYSFAKLFDCPQNG